MSSKEKIYIAIIAIIFGAGFLIYGWNLLFGRNLFKSPKIDFSQFEFRIGDNEFSQNK
ncbi:hypothetical protein HZB94_00575 [Candidatus Falkowbacteria bacterium]|nr:hypothetical protein [Candidatus Falkowbacteria bacterium]